MTTQNYDINVNIKETGADATKKKIADLNAETAKAQGSGGFAGLTSKIEEASGAFGEMTGSVGGAVRGFSQLAGGSAALISGIGGVATVAATATTAIFNLTKEMAMLADDNAELAMRLGVTTDELEALKFIAASTGTSVGSLQSMLDKTAKSMSKLDDDNKKTEQGLAKLGMTFEDIKGMSPEQVAYEVVKAWEQMGRTANATAGASQLLGASFRDNIPAVKMMVEQMNEVKDSTAGLASSKALEEYGGRVEKATLEMQGSWTRLKNTIAEANGEWVASFLEGLNTAGKAMANFVAKWADYNRRTSGENFTREERQQRLQGFTAQVEHWSKYGDDNSRTRAALARDRLAKEQAAIAEMDAAADAERENARFTRQAGAARQARANALSTALNPPTRGGSRTRTRATPSFQDDGYMEPFMTRATSGYNAQVNNIMAGIIKEQQREEERRREMMSREDERNRTNISGIVGQGSRGLSSINFENATRGMGRIDREAFAEMAKVAAESQKAIADLDSTMEGYEERVKAVKDAEEQATASIKLGAEERKKANEDWTTGAADAWTEYIDNLSNTAQHAKDAFATGFQAMEDAIVKFAMTGKLSIKDFTRTVLAELAKFFAKKAILSLIQMFAGSFGGGGGAGTISGGSGMTVPSNFSFGGTFADGGRPPTGKVSVVGERGPELFVPDQAGTIIPNHAMGGQPVIVNNYVSIENVDSDERMERLLQELDRRTEASVNRQLIEQTRRGGMLNPVR